MEITVRVREAVKRGLALRADKMISGNEQCAGCSEGDIALALSDGSRSDRGCRIVSAARGDDDAVGQSQFLRDLTLQGSDLLIALVQLREHVLRDAADLAHLLRPAFILNIQKEHAGRIGVISTVGSAQSVGEIVLRKHDLRDSCEILRFIFLYPEDLRRGESRIGDVRRIFLQDVPSDHLVQIVGLFRSSSVIPQDRGTDHVVILVQNDQSVHLTAEGDAGNLALVLSVQKFLQTCDGLLIPVERVLFRPARMRERQAILFRDDLDDLSLGIHQQKLDG